jgi:hypothetical protein
MNGLNSSRIYGIASWRINRLFRLLPNKKPNWIGVLTHTRLMEIVGDQLQKS